MDTENKDLINNIHEAPESESLEEPVSESLEAAKESVTVVSIDKDKIYQELEDCENAEEDELDDGENAEEDELEDGENAEEDELEESVSEGSAAARKRSFIVQRPIIIAAVSFLLVAVLVLGSVFVYNQFLKPGVDGVWSMPMFGEGVYLIFDRSGGATVDNGVVKYTGKYELFDKEVPNTQTGENEKAIAIKSGVVSELFNEFYGQQLLMYGMTVDFSSAEFIVEPAEDNNSMSIIYEEYQIPLELTRSELPERTVDASVVSHASADELGITALNIDSELVGTWSDGDINYYTFNADGTGMAFVKEEDVLEQTGYSYGFEQHFTYTVYEDSILLTVITYVGDANYGELPYGIEDGKLILGTLEYTKVK